MLKHYFLITVRNMRRHKASFLINLVGLSTGLACAFMIYLWVNDELHFDKFHKNDAQLYQVMETSKENEKVIVHDGTQGPLANAMIKDFPEIESAVTVMTKEQLGMSFPFRAGDKVIKTSGLYAGKDFFHAFSFPLIEGSASEALKDRNSIVLSEKLAAGLFGSPQNAFGKQLEYEIMGMKKTCLVSGVFKTVPENSSMQFDFAMSFDGFVNEIWTNGQQWWNEGPATYLLLKKGTDVTKFNAKLPDYLDKYNKGSIFRLFIRPYSSAYLHGKYDNGIQAGGRIEYVHLFSIIAIFILVIACINFMNLSTAKASRRSKEVGIKKALGSTRKALVFQFLNEAVVMAFLSLLLAGIMVVAFLPMFVSLTGKNLHINLNWSLIAIIIATTIITGLISGSYPAFYLSGFNTIQTLKGKMRNSIGELLARKGLVIFQFTVSLVLIISVIVIYRQVQYVQHKNIGYDKANVVYFDKEGTLNTNGEAFIAELRQLPGIAKASSIQENILQPVTGGSSTYDVHWAGKNPNDHINFIVRGIDYGLLETLDIQLKEGRSFSKNFADSNAVVFNETALRIMGIKDPLNSTIDMWGKKRNIIGIVKDFHVSSLHEQILPMVMTLEPVNTSVIMAKIQPGKEREALGNIQALYKKFNPAYVFEYKFLDEVYQAQYEAEQKVSVLSRYFAGLAILISCLGLFGLAAFNAEIKNKEIGIRKVLGATVTQVMFMLSKDFVRLIVIAIVIAFPLAWWMMNSWLNNFAYKINIGASVFIIAGVSILGVTILIVGYQSLKSAFMNPVNSLRNE